MTADVLFSISNGLVVPGWVLLVFLPKWKWTTNLITSVVIPTLVAVIYVTIIATNFFGSDGGFGSIAEVRTLFENDYLLVAGWAHYLAFDLFIGSWEVRDAQSLGIHHLAVVPCLLLTFMFGPTGLLLYLAIRWGWKRQLVVGSQMAHA